VYYEKPTGVSFTIKYLRRKQRPYDVRNNPLPDDTIVNNFDKYINTCYQTHSLKYVVVERQTLQTIIMVHFKVQ